MTPTFLCQLTSGASSPAVMISNSRIHLSVPARTSDLSRSPVLRWTYPDTSDKREHWLPFPDPGPPVLETISTWSSHNFSSPTYDPNTRLWCWHPDISKYFSALTWSGVKLIINIRFLAFYLHQNMSEWPRRKFEELMFHFLIWPNS